MANEMPKRLVSSQCWIFDLTEKHVATTTVGKSNFEYSASVARELARRWNAHEALVEVVEKFLQAVDLMSVDGVVKVYKEKALLVSKARAALEEAREKP